MSTFRTCEALHRLTTIDAAKLSSILCPATAICLRSSCHSAYALSRFHSSRRNNFPTSNRKPPSWLSPSPLRTALPGSSTFLPLVPVHRLRLFSSSSKPNRTSKSDLSHILFAVTTSAFAFGAAAYVYNEKQRILFAASQPAFPTPSSLLNLWTAHVDHYYKTAWEAVTSPLNDAAQHPFWDDERGRSSSERDEPRFVTIARGWWDRAGEDKQTVYALMMANTVVFAAWQVGFLRPFMMRWFLHTPNGGNPVTMLTSVFSHHELWHFGFNMLALSSIGETVCRLLGREQFLAYYFSAGLASSLFSHLFRSRLNADAHIGGLGASGALYGCFALTALRFPEASGHIIFLPFVPLKLGHMLPAMMALDVIGIVRKWRSFDHYAHLGGTLFGGAYHLYGHEYLWNPSRRIMAELSK